MIRGNSLAPLALEREALLNHDNFDHGRSSFTQNRFTEVLVENILALKTRKLFLSCAVKRIQFIEGNRPPGLPTFLLAGTASFERALFKDIFQRPHVARPLRTFVQSASQFQPQERKRMNRNKTLLTAVAIGGIVGLATGPSWSQDAPRGSRQANPEQVPRGSNENIPAARGAAQELSTNDMKLIQQRLQERGYNPGNINGTADDMTRAAIRKFQQDHGVAVTGTIDEHTANQLGFQYSKNPTKGGTASDQPVPSERPSNK